MTRQRKYMLLITTGIVLVVALCSVAWWRHHRSAEVTTAQPETAPKPPAVALKAKEQDTLPDDWKMARFGTLKVDPKADPDGDGLTNLQEYQRGTDPNRPTTIKPWDDKQVTINVSGAEGVAGEGKRGPDGQIYFRHTYERLLKEGKFKVPWDKLP